MIGLIASRVKEEWKWLSMFTIAFVSGMLTHILYDLLDGYVAILAPFSFELYSLTGFSYQTFFGDTYYKVWNAFSCMTYIIPYLLLWYWATHKANITSELKFAKVLLIFSFISMAIFGTLMVVAFTDISVEMHLALVYAIWSPIFPSITTILLHIKMRETIQDFSFLDFRKS